MAHNEEINTKPELTQILDLANIVIKTVSITIFHMLKKVKWRYGRYKKEGNKMKLLEKKNTMCNMKNMLDRINGKLDFVDKKINKPEYETIENV